MSSNVEPEEVEAILAECEEAVRHADEVAQRDFRQPRRMSAERAAELRRAVLTAKPLIELRLAALLGNSLQPELVDIREVSSEGLFEAVSLPLAMARFEVGDQLAWVVWENRVAVTCVDLVLGSLVDADDEDLEEAEEPCERDLSRIERRMLCAILACVVEPVCRTLGFEPLEMYGVGDIVEIGSWRDSRERDPHRIAVEFNLRGPEPNTLRLYLPAPRGPLLCTRPGDDQLEATAPALPAPRLPEHLEKVRLSVSARLGSVEVPLADLLALEEGDVIPLGSAMDDSLDLYVEDRPCGKARMGSHRGKLAMRIETTRPVRDED